VSHAGYDTRLPMRTALILVSTLIGYIAAENLIFNTSWYPTVVNPDSSTGRIELVLWNEHQRVKNGPQVLTIGDSRMGFFPRYVNGDPKNGPKNGYTFGTISCAGSTPRDWFYMFRDIDPTRRAYQAIVIPVESYDDPEMWENHANRETDLHYSIALLGWRDLREFAGSYQSLPLQAKAALGIALKGSIYRADFQDLLKNRRVRLAYAADARVNSHNWYGNYTGPEYSVSGIQIDWAARTLLVPPGHRAGEKDVFQGRLFSHEPPDAGLYRGYMSYWFGRIYDLYRDSPTRIVFFRLPRGPYIRPDRPPRDDRSSVRMLAMRPRVILDDEHYFETLERPELFQDPMHFNGKGEAEFSKMLGAHLRELLGPPAD
jgi:hypothetical protein